MSDAWICPVCFQGYSRKFTLTPHINQHHVTGTAKPPEEDTTQEPSKKGGLMKKVIEKSWTAVHMMILWRTVRIQYTMAVMI